MRALFQLIGRGVRELSAAVRQVEGRVLAVPVEPPGPALVVDDSAGTYGGPK